MKMTTTIRREAKRFFHLCLVNGTLDEQRVRQVVERVLESRPRGYLVLLGELQRLIKLDRTAHTAEVESAEPLPDDLRLRVQTGLEEMYGAGISTSFVRNPALIGGMRIKVGSDVYDGSVRAELDALEKRF